MEISLYVPPVNPPKARTIAGEEAKELLDISNKRIEQYNSRARQTLGSDNLSIRSGELVGSSYLIRAHLDSILRENFNSRVVSLDDMGIMLANDPKALAEIYIDGPLVRYSESGLNAYLNNRLTPQLKKLGWKDEAPIIIEGLEAVADRKSEHGLAFKAGDHTEWQYAPWLAQSQARKFSSFDGKGINFDVKGKYIFRPGSAGLTGLALPMRWYLPSDCELLAFSSSAGRVAVKGGEAAT